MPGSTTRGFPYPLPNEPVAAGATAIRALAEAVDTRGHVQCGAASITLSNAMFGTVAITYPRAFARAPRVAVSVVGSSTYFAYLGGTPSLTAATLAVRQYKDIAQTATVPVSWIATDAS